MGVPPKIDLSENGSQMSCTDFAFQKWSRMKNAAATEINTVTVAQDSADRRPIQNGQRQQAAPAPKNLSEPKCREK